ncbi:MAG TPA: cytochrome b N-terminal domain-containing protein [Longimicrobiales bacterium]
MNSVFVWIDQRIDLRGIKAALLDREVPERLTWWHTLGSATLTVFAVQIITGIVLATYYAAAPDHAYDSVQYIQGQLIAGSIVRGIHHWAASLMIILVILHMIRVFAMGAYKYPREINWLLGVGMLLLVLGFGFTGYLLPWDQRAYWATQVGTNIAGTTPFIGPVLVKMLRGGAELGAATLTHFYAFHVLWLPLLLGGFVFLHLALVIRQGIAPRPHALEKDAPQTTAAESYPAYYHKQYAKTKSHGVRFWPDIIGKDAAVALLVVVILVVLGTLRAAHLEAPADPTDSSYVPTPEWYFLPFYQLLKLVPGSLEAVVAAGIPALLLIVLFALPFFDRRSTRNLLHRPAALVSLLFVLGSAGMLLGAAVRERQPAQPPEIGRPLTPAERAGRALYRQQGCGSCHTLGGVGSGSAPDLLAIGLRHSPAWIHSFLEEPARFRPGTKMPGFGPPIMTHQEIEELSLYLASLKGPPGKNLEPQVADTFPTPEQK